MQTQPEAGVRGSWLTVTTGPWDPPLEGPGAPLSLGAHTSPGCQASPSSCFHSRAPGPGILAGGRPGWTPSLWLCQGPVTGTVELRPIQRPRFSQGVRVSSLNYQKIKLV